MRHAVCKRCGEGYYPMLCYFEEHISQASGAACGGLPDPISLAALGPPEDPRDSQDNGCNDDECPWAACPWCAGRGCQACGYTGHELDEESGLPIGWEKT